MKLDSGIELSHQEIVEMIQNWGTDMQIGENYDFITVFYFLYENIKKLNKCDSKLKVLKKLEKEEVDILEKFKENIVL